MRGKKDPTWWLNAVVVPVDEFKLWHWPQRCVVCLDPATETLDVGGRIVELSRSENLPTMRTTYSSSVVLTPHSIPYCAAHLEESRERGEELVTALPGWVHEFTGSQGVQRLGVHFSLLAVLPDAPVGRQVSGLRVRVEFSNGAYAIELARENLSLFIGLERRGFTGEILESEWFGDLPKLGEVGGSAAAEGIMRLLAQVTLPEGMIDFTLSSPLSVTGLGRNGLVGFAALSKIGQPAFPSIVDALSHPKSALREFGVRLAALMPDFPGLAHLVRTAREDANHTVRAAAVQALVERYSDERLTVETLEIMAAEDSDRTVRKRAEKSLKRIHRAASKGR